jgi:hypothetical protein
MFRVNRKLFLFIVPLVALGGVPGIARAQEIRFRADLMATGADPLASGHADWRLDTQNGQRRLSVEIEDVASTDRVRIIVGRRTIGFLNIVNGFGDLNLDSTQGHLIPRAGPGTPVEVRRASDNVLILTGAFAPD